MTNIKATKRALGSSVLALFLCFAMLLGTTFAWFTDSVTSANNIITAGNLDIEVYYAYPSDVVDGDIPADAWKLMKSDVSIFDNNALWEPGYTQAVFFKFENAGSLALQYEFKVDILNETTGKTKENADIQLSNHINAYICNNFQWNYKDFLFADRGDATNPEGAPTPYYTTLREAATMAPNRADNYTENALSLDSWQWLKPAEVTYATMVLWMPTSVGNEVNHNGTDVPSIDLGITVLATQYNYDEENDSFGKDYDADAKFPIVSAPEKLPENATEGTTITAGTDNKGVAVTVPANTINNIKEKGTTSISLVHTEPKVVDNTIVFDSIDIVDQTGKVIDLYGMGNTEAIKVTLPAQTTFTSGDKVTILHDGVVVAHATVNNDTTISYEVTHFCEVQIGKTDVPVTDETTGNLVIKTPEQFFWFALDVNGGNTYKGKTVVLGADIDLDNAEWTPIGNSTNKFQGTFDGNGKTISNLKITGNKSNVGLFGFTTDGEIRNLTVENAIVSGRLNVGVVAGTPYTSKYTNITVKGHVEVNGMSYVGGVGGKNAYADWTDITVEVDETSYVNANSVENGTAYRTYVGGVVGFNGEGGHTFSNITSNIDVCGTTCDVGGAFGIAHYGNKFENVTVTGNVECLGETDEIGGIAGVWHNENGTSVAFTNCKFTGKLSANVEGVDLENNDIVGAAYNKTGNGTLVIDDNAYVAVNTGDELVAALENGNNVIFVDNIKIDPANMSNAYGKTGINVKNGQTIDGNGFTLDVKGAGGTWDSGINTTGGIIKNITVTGSFRGIFVNHTSDYSESVVLENVIIYGTTYTISCDQGLKQTLVATNCTFNGWTSYAATLGNAKFVDCKFGEGNGYAYCRPYAPTEFVGCDFEAGFRMDARATVTFENCTIGGVALTAENLATLVTSNIANASVK